MAYQLESFKKQLEKLKAKGLDINLDEVLQEIENEQPKTKLDKRSFSMVELKMKSLLKDFQEVYGTEGRSLTVTIHIGKENSADTYTENFNYGNYNVVHEVEIGTKGKYESVGV